MWPIAIALSLLATPIDWTAVDQAVAAAAAQTDRELAGRIAEVTRLTDAVWQPRPATNVCIVGVKGEGKTEFLRQWVRSIRRVIVWDRLGNFEMGQGTLTPDQLERQVEFFRRGVVHVALRPVGRGREERIAEFDRVCHSVWRIGAVHFVIDEVSHVCEPRAVPPWFDELITAGRNRGISLAAAGQRFAQFPRVFSGNADRIIAFRQLEPADLDDLEKRFGGEQLSARTLARHHFLDWTPFEGVVHRSPLTLQRSTS